MTALQDQLVSWFSIALPDLSLTLLTVGFQTYSADTRYMIMTITVIMIMMIIIITAIMIMITIGSALTFNIQTTTDSGYLGSGTQTRSVEICHSSRFRDIFAQLPNLLCSPPTMRDGFLRSILITDIVA